MDSLITLFAIWCIWYVVLCVCARILFFNNRVAFSRRNLFATNHIQQIGNAYLNGVTVKYGSDHRFWTFSLTHTNKQTHVATSAHITLRMLQLMLTVQLNTHMFLSFFFISSLLFPTSKHSFVTISVNACLCVCVRFISFFFLFI